MWALFLTQTLSRFVVNSIKQKVFSWIGNHCKKLNEGESFDMLMLQSLQLKYFSMHLINMTCSSANLSITLKQ